MRGVAVLEACPSSIKYGLLRGTIGCHPTFWGMANFLDINFTSKEQVV